MISITTSMDSKNIPRLKIGIGRPNTRDPFKISMYVTSDFDEGKINNSSFYKKLWKFRRNEYFAKWSIWKGWDHSSGKRIFA